MESSSDDEDHQQETPPPPPPYGDEEEVNGPPDDELITNFLWPMVTGFSYADNDYIKIIHESPYELGFFEPQNIREYCTIEGRKERERYFYLPRPAGPELLVGHTGQWLKQGTEFIDIDDVLRIAQCTTFQFVLRNYPGFPSRPPTAWRLYEYRLEPDEFLLLPDESWPWDWNWTLYKLSQVGNLPPDSPRGSLPSADTGTSDSVDGQAGASDGDDS